MASRRLLEPQASIRELLLVSHHCSVVAVLHPLVTRHRAFLLQVLLRASTLASTLVSNWALLHRVNWVLRV
jgi:hypothetical protein